jgi:hypothetical protein
MDMEQGRGQFRVVWGKWGLRLGYDRVPEGMGAAVLPAVLVWLPSEGVTESGEWDMKGVVQVIWVDWVVHVVVEIWRG